MGQHNSHPLLQEQGGREGDPMGGREGGRGLDGGGGGDGEGEGGA